MNLWQKQALFVQDVAALTNYMFSKGYFCTFGEAYRTPEQAALNAKVGKGIVNSLHIQRLAIDLNLFAADGTFLNNCEDHKEFGKYWESLDPQNRWGGNFPNLKDGNHYERRA